MICAAPRRRAGGARADKGGLHPAAGPRTQVALVPGCRCSEGRGEGRATGERPAEEGGEAGGGERSAAVPAPVAEAAVTVRWPFRRARGCHGETRRQRVGAHSLALPRRPSPAGGEADLPRCEGARCGVKSCGPWAALSPAGVSGEVGECRFLGLGDNLKKKC